MTISFLFFFFFCLLFFFFFCLTAAKFLFHSLLSAFLPLLSLSLSLSVFLSPSPCLPPPLPPALSHSLSPGCPGWCSWGVQTSQGSSVPARGLKKTRLPGLCARHASCDRAPALNTGKLSTFDFHQPQSYQIWALWMSRQIPVIHVFNVSIIKFSGLITKMLSGLLELLG